MPINFLFDLGIFLLLLGLIKNIYGRIIFLFLSIIFIWKRHKHCWFILLIPLFLFFNFSFNKKIEINDEFVGRVITIKENYYLVSNNKAKVILYTSKELNYDDEILIKGDFSEFSATSNRTGFNYYEYLSANNISYNCSNEEVTILKNGKTLRNIIYRHNKDKRLVKFFIFNIYPNDLDDSLFLLLGCGMHLSYLFYILRNILNKYLEEDKTNHSLTIITILIGIFYNFNFFSIRILIRNLVNYLPLSKKEKWGLQTILLLIMFPKMGNQFSFLLPTLFGLGNCYGQKASFIQTFVTINLLNLFNNGYSNILIVLTNYFLNPLFSIIFIFAILQSLLPIKITLGERIIDLLLNVKFDYSLELIGKPHLFLVILILVFLFQYLKSKDFKLLVTIFAMLLINNYAISFRPYAFVSYIDVGQGDSCLISLPFNKGNILIDTGGNKYKDIASDILYPILKGYGIRKLNYVLITHEDIDHSGALEKLKDLIEIDQIITSKEQKIDLNEFEIKILNTSKRDNDNENSLVSYFNVYGLSFFGMADVTSEIEKEICNIYPIQADVIKLSHHGSNTSSSQKLLETTKPKIAIISSGKNNSYHHPSKEVIERLENNRIYYLNTAYQGQIEIYITALFKFIRTNNGGFAIIK